MEVPRKIVILNRSAPYEWSRKIFNNIIIILDTTYLNKYWYQLISRLCWLFHTNNNYDKKKKKSADILLISNFNTAYVFIIILYRVIIFIIISVFFNHFGIFKLCLILFYVITPTHYTLISSISYLLLFQSLFIYLLKTFIDHNHNTFSQFFYTLQYFPKWHFLCNNYKYSFLIDFFNKILYYNYINFIILQSR